MPARHRRYGDAQRLRHHDPSHCLLGRQAERFGGLALPCGNGEDRAAEYLGQIGRGIDRKAGDQRQKLRGERQSADGSEAPRPRQIDPAPQQERHQGDAGEGQRSARANGSSPHGTQQDRTDDDRDEQDRPSRIGQGERGEVQSPIIEVERSDGARAGSGQTEQQRDVPDEHLEQQGNIANQLDVKAGEPRNVPSWCFSSNPKH